MLTYRLQARRLVIDKLPSFPAEAVVKMKLDPRVPFGGLAGPTRTIPKGGTAKVRVNTARGTFTCNLDEELYPTLDFARSFQEDDGRQSELRVDGNALSVKFDCTDLGALASRIILFENIFPAILTAYMPDAPHTTEITGTLAGRKFSWLYNDDTLRLGTVVATAIGQQENLCSSYGMMLASRGKTRLMIGFHYFYQGCRLLTSGRNRFEFAGEVVLNFARALQALFGEGKDPVRTALRGLGYNDIEIEGKFIPLLELRNNFDSAHRSLRILEADDLDTIHEYVRDAEEWMRELMKRIIERTRARKLNIPADPKGELSKDQKRVLRRLRENLERLRSNKIS